MISNPFHASTSCMTNYRTRGFLVHSLRCRNGSRPGWEAEGDDCFGIPLRQWHRPGVKRRARDGQSRRSGC